MPSINKDANQISTQKNVVYCESPHYESRIE